MSAAERAAYPSGQLQQIRERAARHQVKTTRNYGVLAHCISFLVLATSATVPRGLTQHNRDAQLRQMAWFRCIACNKAFSQILS